jgi:hypothetical protein
MNHLLNQSKKEKEFQKMVDECVRNSKLRSKDPKEHEAWRKSYAEMLRAGEREVASLSNKIAGVCTKTQIDDSRWKDPYKDDDELNIREQKAQQEVDRKRKRIAPAYSKGNYQYITDLKDISTLGRKI